MPQFSTLDYQIWKSWDSLALNLWPTSVPTLRGGAWFKAMLRCMNRLPSCRTVVIKLPGVAAVRKLVVIAKGLVLSHKNWIGSTYKCCSHLIVSSRAKTEEEEECLNIALLVSGSVIVAEQYLTSPLSKPLCQYVSTRGVPSGDGQSSDYSCCGSGKSCLKTEKMYMAQKQILINQHDQRRTQVYLRLIRREPG